MQERISLLRRLIRLTLTIQIIIVILCLLPDVTLCELIRKSPPPNLFYDPFPPFSFRLLSVSSIFFLFQKISYSFLSVTPKYAAFTKYVLFSYVFYGEYVSRQIVPTLLEPSSFETPSVHCLFVPFRSSKFQTSLNMYLLFY